MSANCGHVAWVIMGASPTSHPDIARAYRETYVLASTGRRFLPPVAQLSGHSPGTGPGVPAGAAGDASSALPGA